MEQKSEPVKIAAENVKLTSSRKRPDNECKTTVAYEAKKIPKIYNSFCGNEVEDFHVLLCALTTEPEKQVFVSEIKNSNIEQ